MKTLLELHHDSVLRMARLPHVVQTEKRISSVYDLVITLIAEARQEGRDVYAAPSKGMLRAYAMFREEIATVYCESSAPLI